LTIPVLLLSTPSVLDSLNMNFIMLCLLLFSQHSCVNSQYVCTYYMFQPIVAIVRYVELLQSPFLLSDVLPYTGHCFIVYVCCLCNALML
jgi:hypothetical protein